MPIPVLQKRETNIFVVVAQVARLTKPRVIAVQTELDHSAIAPWRRNPATGRGEAKKSGPQIFVRNAKNALDARLVSHANLNVGLFEKASVVVDTIALDKHRLDCLEGR
jgi:hypothetical protein